MKAVIREQGALLRCHICGSSQVNSICHHCDKPMCKRHGPVKPTFSWFTENREFNRLPLGAWPLSETQGAHCNNCVHGSPNYRRIMIIPGIVITLVGFVMALLAVVNLGDCLSRLPVSYSPGIVGVAEVLRDPDVYMGLETGRCYQPDISHNIWSTLRALLLLGFGFGVTVTGIYLNREHIAASQAGWRPRVPLGPISDLLDVRENMKIRISSTVDGRQQSEQLGIVTGQFNPELTFTSYDLDCIQTYREKYGEDTAKVFNAGHLVLDGRPRFRFTSPETVAPTSDICLKLNGDITQNHFLSQHAGPVSAAYPVAWAYTVIDDLNDAVRDWGCSPLRLVPVPAGLGNDRALRLEIQFNKAFFPWFPEDMPVLFDAINLQFDASTPFDRPKANGMVTYDKENGFYRVTYRGLQFDPSSGSILNSAIPGTVEFPHAIPSQGVVRGSMRLHIPALYSGLRRIRYFNALGYAVGANHKSSEPYPFRGVTVLDVEFSLSLQNLPQASRAALPLNTMVAPGAPDTTRVRQILDAFNAAGLIYANRMVEDPRRHSETGATFNRWHWDISGRRYCETLPIDFHLTVFGDGESQDQGGRGSTHIDGTVQSYVFDATSKRNLSETRDELTAIIQQVLEITGDDRKGQNGDGNV